MPLNPNIIQFKDAQTDASIYPVGLMEAVFDSSSANSMYHFLEEYNVSAHHLNTASGAGSRTGKDLFILSEAITFVPTDYIHNGLTVTFKTDNNGNGTYHHTESWVFKGTSTTGTGWSNASNWVEFDRNYVDLADSSIRSDLNQLGQEVKDYSFSEEYAEGSYPTTATSIGFGANAGQKIMVTISTTGSLGYGWFLTGIKIDGTSEEIASAYSARSNQKYDILSNYKDIKIRIAAQNSGNISFSLILLNWKNGVDTNIADLFSKEEIVEDKVNQLENFVPNSLGEGKVTFNLTEGVDHSSAKDRIALNIKQGEIVVVYWSSGSEGDVRGQVYAEIENESQYQAIGTLLNGETRMIVASANIVSLGVYVSSPASSSVATFSAINSFGTTQKVDDLTNISFVGKGTTYSRGSYIYNLVKGRRYRVCFNNTWEKPSGASGNVFSVEGMREDTDALDLIVGITTPQLSVDFVITHDYKYIYIGGKANNNVEVKANIVDITEVYYLSTEVGKLTEDAYFYNSGVIIIDGKGSTGIQKNFQAIPEHDYIVNIPSSWSTESTGADLYLFAIGYYDGTNYKDIHHFMRFSDNRQVYKFRGVDNAKYYYIFLRADVGEVVPVSVIDNTDFQPYDKIYSGERINLGNRCCLTELFQLSEIGTPSIVVASQGMDIYEDKYLFQGNDSNDGRGIYIIDLETRELVGSFDFTGYTYFHFNTICCGNKYDDADKFPLLYLTQMKEDYKCVVIRIDDSGNSYEEIQTITYSGTHYVGSLGYNFAVDLPNNKIYLFGLPTGQADARVEITKFALPNIGNANVVLTDSDILDNFIVTDCEILQGCKVINGKIYAPFGWGIEIDPTSPSLLKVIDLSTKSVVSSVDIREIGEAEDVALYKGCLMTLNNSENPIYYLLDFM